MMEVRGGTSRIMMECKWWYQSYKDGGTWWYQSYNGGVTWWYQSYNGGGTWWYQSYNDGVYVVVPVV